MFFTPTVEASQLAAGSNSSRTRLRRCAFTLVEALVVIVLMSVLTGMMTFALSGARQDARVRRAEAEIAAINAVLQHKMNEINLQPVLYQPAYESAAAVPGNPVSGGDERNRVSMLARRDLMRMVLPQCRADLIYPPARLQYRRTVRMAGSNGLRPCAVKVKPPVEWSMMRRVAGFVNPNPTNVDMSSGVDPLSGINGYFSNLSIRQALGRIREVGGSISTIDLGAEPWGSDLSADSGQPWTRQYESAECLYLILASTEIHGERALDQLHPRSIANLDGDNVPEIVDPWGRPYEFIRDATGYGFPFFVRSVSYSIDPSNPPDDIHPDGPDANDYLRTDFRYKNSSPGAAPYRITPLVVSAGPDGEFGIRRSFDPDGSVSDGSAGISPRQSIAALQLGSTGITPTLPGTYQYPDPFAFVADTHPTFTIPMGTLGERTIQAWFRGSGLGARLYESGTFRIDESSVDNIYSSGAIR